MLREYGILNKFFFFKDNLLSSGDTKPQQNQNEPQLFLQK